MKQFLTVLVAGGVLAASAWAQSSATGTTTTNTSATTGNTNAQVNTQTQTDTSTSSDKNKTQKQDNTNANTSSSTSANVGGNHATATSNVVVGAELSKSLDAKKVKPGDPVEAKSTSDALLEGGVKVPRGSKLIGHVTQAQAHSKEQAHSTLGILFDKAETKQGEVPFHAFVQALSAPPPAVMESDNDDMSSGGMGGMNRQQPTGGGGMMGSTPNVGGTVGAVGNTVGQTANTAGQTAGGVTGNVGGRLNASSQGAVNLPGLKLDTAASNTTNGSVITSDSKTVKLDSGTQLVLRVIAQ